MPRRKNTSVVAYQSTESEKSFYFSITIGGTRVAEMQQAADDAESPGTWVLTWGYLSFPCVAGFETKDEAMAYVAHNAHRITQNLLPARNQVGQYTRGEQMQLDRLRNILGTGRFLPSGEKVALPTPTPVASPVSTVDATSAARAIRKLATTYSGAKMAGRDEHAHEVFCKLLDTVLLLAQREQVDPTTRGISPSF